MSVRQQVRAMANRRAMEIQEERENPIAPSLRGKGATPSMGLSQFRGGRARAKNLDDIIQHDEAEHPSLYLEEADEMAEMPSGEYDGAGMSGGAREQGAALAAHLKKLRGSAFHKAFMEGMAMAGAGVNFGAYEGEGKMCGGGPLELEIKHESCAPRAVGAGRVKRPVAASDGRRRRAEIVKKVMVEKGLKMIEASRYVKEHGLYK
jgi:hypothetical protein